MNYPKDHLDIKSDFDKSHKLQPSNSKINLSLPEIISDIKRLKTILSEESKNMKNMNIEAVREVHEEKMKLIRKLELQKELVKKQPQILGKGSSQDIIDFAEASEGMEEALKENYIEALKAKEINQRIVEAVSKAVSDNRKKSLGYGKQGYGATGIVNRTENLAKQAQSIAINQMI